MKILNSKLQSTDNRLKFADRFKVILPDSPQNGIDPYVFHDTEQQLQQQQQPQPQQPQLVVSTGGGKNIKLIAPKNSKIPNSNRNKSKGKCLKTQIKIEPGLNDILKTEPLEAADSPNNSQYVHQPHPYAASQDRQRHLKNLQRLKAKQHRSRDHTLQYYPRATEEISDSESSGDEVHTFQRHWYTGEPDPSLSRSSRLAQLHSQLQRQLQQLQSDDEETHWALKQKTHYLLQAAARDPTTTGRILSGSRVSRKIADGPLVVGGPCGAEGCQQTSLPCTRHCSRHIMLNGEQLLFEHCTAKFSDNTQCSVPVFDVAHELPLCPEHARKRDNYHRRAQESKPKKARSKKPASPNTAAATATAPRPPSKSKSRPKKKKRPPSRSKLEIQQQQQQQPVMPVMPLVVPPMAMPVPVPVPMQIQQQQQQPIIPMPTAVMPTQLMQDENHYTSPIMPTSEMLLHTKTLNNLIGLPSLQQQHQHQHQQPVVNNSVNAVTNLNSLGLDLGSLGLGAALKVELDDHEVFASLDHATEHDFENVLNNLPADAFNDLFIGNCAIAGFVGSRRFENEGILVFGLC